MTIGSTPIDIAFVMARLRWAMAAGSWACVVALVVLSLAPIDPSMRTSAGGLTEHFIAYGLTAIALVAAYGLIVGRIPVLLLLVGLSGSLELLQNVAPGRHPHFVDFAAGSAGAIGGVLVAWLSLLLLNSYLMIARARTN